MKLLAKFYFDLIAAIKSIPIDRSYTHDGPNRSGFNLDGTPLNGGKVDIQHRPFGITDL